MTSQSPMLRRNFKGGAFMEQQLAYSFHLGSDKNKSKLAKKVAKGNVSGTTSLSNNAIQNANALSKVNKHNLRDYDNERDLIIVIRGTNDIVEDVKDLYLEEFEEARIKYNNKQTRNDRKIDNYFMKINESQNDLACEIIVELGDMEFWKDKDKDYRLKMTDVYNEQVNDLAKILPTFKIANATIHFDETSPHMHIVGVPIIENCTRGMKKQVGKSQLFTKESLTKIQDKMRTACIKSFNKFYDMDIKLTEKQKGRNQDINVKDMSNYSNIKKQLAEKEKKLDKANKQTNKLDNTTKDINQILDNLKPAKFSKNNMVISNEDIEKIKNFTQDVKDKLRLAICMSQSKWSGLIYNTKENYEKFDAMLKEIDEEYRTTLINFAKYQLVMFAMSKLMEMETTEQNQVALYVFNNINLKTIVK